MKRVAEALGVSRSNLAERARGKGQPRGPYRKATDEALLPLIRRFVDERPTYGYRRITALVNRELATQSLPSANRKRVHRIMQRHALLLERHTGRREGRIHDGKVMVMRSNLRWCSDGLEFTCWNGDILRLAFIIDAFDREIIAWTAVSGAGISGSDVRDMMLEAVEKRFADTCAPHPDRASLGQRQPLHRQGHPRLRGRPEPGALLHSGPQSGVERHGGSLRQNLQARLCSRAPFAGRPSGASANRRMDRRLQRDPSSLSAQDALPEGVHPSSGPIAGVSGETGGTPAAYLMI